MIDTKIHNIPFKKQFSNTPIMFSELIQLFQNKNLGEQYTWEIDCLNVKD